MNVKDKNEKESEVYIIENKIKSHIGGTLVIIIIVIFITAVAMTGVYLNYW